MRRPYSLQKRKTSRGEIIYYVQFWNEEKGKYGTARSTGKSSKGAAANWADNEIKEGKSKIPRFVYFRDFADSFYDWETSKWVKMKRMAENIHRSRVDLLGGILRKHLLPYFGDMKISSMTAVKVEDFLSDLSSKGYKSGTIRNIFYALNNIMYEAKRRKTIAANPCPNARKPRSRRRREKGILSMDEAKQLFDESKIDKIWGDGNSGIMHYTINLIAAGTGLRMNEIQALRLEAIDFQKKTVEISRGWERAHGWKDEPKTDNSFRKVPISENMIKYIQKVLPAEDLRGPGTVVFQGRFENRPISQTVIGAHFNTALANIGIKNRQARNISFHSWRHFWKTYLINHGISVYSAMKIVGHTQIDTSYDYSHLDEDALQKIRVLQGQIA